MVQPLWAKMEASIHEGLHQNISQYTKSGSAGIRAARGEITIGVVFVHGAVKQAVVVSQLKQFLHVKEPVTKSAQQV